MMSEVHFRIVIYLRDMCFEKLVSFLASAARNLQAFQCTVHGGYVVILNCIVAALLFTFFSQTVQICKLKRN